MSLWRQITFVQLVCVGQNQAVRNELCDSCYAGHVRYVAGSEDERRLLAMQIGQLSFKLDQRVIGPSNIARAAGAHTKTACSFHKRADHLRMLSHSKIIVRAPDNDFTPAFRRMVDGVGKAARNALEVGEHSVAPFFLQLTQCSGEITVVIHLALSDGSKVCPIAV